MFGKYILDENNQPVLIEDVMEWARWFEKADRVVARSVVGIYTVSTVFLGTDHRWDGGPPILWETMIFTSEPNELDEFQERYTSHEDALSTHKIIVQGLPEVSNGM
jgi:hypothetical protein